ncbi:MAG: hypothetical protein AB7V44_12710 [Pseudonocardia sp.]
MSTRTGRAHAGTRAVKPVVKPVDEPVDEPVDTAVGVEKAGGKADGAPRSVTIELPLVTAQVRAPQLPRIPGQDAVTGAVSTAAAGVASAARGVAGVAGETARGIGDAAGRTRKVLPSAPVLFYAGLAATAALGAISWPVAVAIGIGTAVARATTRDAGERKEAEA